MPRPRRIVIVGGSLAGLRAAEAARASGFDGDLALVGEEPHLPYHRPPLSKEVLSAGRPVEGLALRSPEQVAELGLELHLGTRARSLDVDRRRLVLDGGELAWDGLVIATGCSPRTLPGAKEREGVFAVRALEDAIALREALGRSSRVAVVGAGFIGGEVAASARALGLDVTILEALPAPLADAIGARLGSVYRELHASRGTELRCGVQVQGLEGNGRVEAVRLSDGSRVEADVVVVGIGVRPAVDWLHGSGLLLEDGLRCDAALRAAPGVYGAGDVARWDNPRYGVAMRVEHWTNAAEQGAHAARNLVTGEARPYEAIPYFWSDQYGSRLQFAGRFGPGDEVVTLRADGDGARWVGLYGGAERLTGVLAIEAPALFARLRLLLRSGAPLTDGLATASRAGFEPAPVE